MATGFRRNKEFIGDHVFPPGEAIGLITRRAEKHNIASLLDDLQTASLGRLACGHQTDEQIEQSQRIITELETKGYPSEMYLRELARHGFSLNNEDLIKKAEKMFDTRQKELGIFYSTGQETRPKSKRSRLDKNTFARLR